jgi:hypothetical protein
VFSVWGCPEYVPNKHRNTSGGIGWMLTASGSPLESPKLAARGFYEEAMSFKLWGFQAVCEKP